MPILNALILVIILSFSWYTVQNRTGIPDRVHSAIQQSVRQLIEDYVKNNLEQLKSFSFNNMWSETLEENKIKVNFTYNYTEKGDINSQRTGHIILFEELDSSQPGGKLWAQKELKILNQVITFNQPLLILDDNEK